MLRLYPLMEELKMEGCFGSSPFKGEGGRGMG